MNTWLKGLGLIVFLLASQVPSYAQDMKFTQLALQLGDLLASEELCKLAYNQSAIEKFIDEKVSADDLTFPSQLSLFTDGKRYEQKSMSESQKTAHCRQTQRLAVSFGFVEKAQ